jgi:hypothetical protein
MSNRLFFGALWFVLFVFALVMLVGNAFGQCCQYSNTVPMVPTWQPPDHSLRAEPHGLGVERDLRERGGITMAQGERPAWELDWPAEKSLGDVAREYREEHKKVKKATKRYYK